MDMLFCFRRHSLLCCVEFAYFLYFLDLFYLPARSSQHCGFMPGPYWYRLNTSSTSDYSVW